jgi:hypothetical protein
MSLPSFANLLSSFGTTPLGNLSMMIQPAIASHQLVAHLRLSEHPHERLIQLLDELYAPGCEKQWVHYAVELLTSLAR